MDATGRARALILLTTILVVSSGENETSSRGARTEQSQITSSDSHGIEGLIAFSRAGAHGGIYTMASDGSGSERLTIDPGDSQPAWSPDASRIAFVRYDEGSQNIYVMNADGTRIRRLTSDGASGNPTWSPDGTRIAFQREADGNADIYVMNADGSNVDRLTGDPLLEYTPAWSPDGTAIAFVGFEYTGAGPSPVRLSVMNLDGSQSRQIGPSDVAQPNWSHDGRSIAFVEAETGSISVINRDGSGLRRLVDLEELTHTRGNLTMSPAWSPDDSHIAFASGSHASSTHIYVVREDGSDLRQLTDDPVSDASPDWSLVPTADCGKTNIATDAYGTEIHPTSGPPGTEITFSGTTVRGEDWRWAPSDRLEAWWNTDAPASEVPGGTPVKDGPVMMLARIDDMERCRFETTFAIPDVEPGRYKISVFAWDANSDAGYGLFLPHHFVVTDPETPACDGAESYGQTIPGRWLEDLLVDIGAPGNHAVTHDQVGDTGTTLSIDIPAYEHGPTLYATMLAKPFPVNEDWEAPEKEIDRHGEFRILLTRGDFAWESYRARSDDWQLALIAYPGAENNEVTWPEGTLDWLARAVDLTQESPPECSGR
jgi:Tol biopolymer transport system component